MNYSLTQIHKKQKTKQKKKHLSNSYNELVKKTDKLNHSTELFIESTSQTKTLMKLFLY